MNGIADTGFIVAFARRADRHHAWAVQVAREIAPPLLTCEAVLAEATFHLGSASYVLELVRDGLLRPAFPAAEHLDRLHALASQFADRKPDFADLCLICMSEIHPEHLVVTTDRADFPIYRRHQRQVLPLLSPPA